MREAGEGKSKSSIKIPEDHKPISLSKFSPKTNWKTFVLSRMVYYHNQYEVVGTAHAKTKNRMRQLATHQHFVMSLMAKIYPLRKFLGMLSIERKVKQTLTWLIVRSNELYLKEYKSNLKSKAKN
ncbi:unnamed protein product [Ambrosiozyma monospora]|uniref:Unnamed protein product n=1 Tax=Ambrosiozyma monospora TaxID=43982 RepID=A0ACB5SWH6_AMBMO|nr:unnamed protein product [Ambrosiozyma monospora]